MLKCKTVENFTEAINCVYIVEMETHLHVPFSCVALHSDHNDFIETHKP